MLKFFSYMHSWLTSSGLSPCDYEVVIRCRSRMDQDRPESVMAQEFSKLLANTPVDYPPVRYNSGICYEIKFEITT